MFFVAPGQIFGFEASPDSCPRLSGWILNIHPDFLWDTPLAKTMKQYEFFGQVAGTDLNYT